MLDVALQSHEHLGIQVSVSIRYWVSVLTNSKLHATDTFCEFYHPSINILLKIIWVFISFTISDLHYLQEYQMIAVENCFQFLGKSRI
jgi:hypothetical protein